MKGIYVALIWMAVASICSFGQDADGKPADTMTGVFDDHIRTLQLSVDGRVGQMPVILLDGGNRLTVEWDCLSDELEYMRYELIHCNRFWQPSGLVDSEFLDGFNEGTVDDYAFSRATTVHYVHYSITLPNDDMRPLISGNYLLRVYPENEPDVTWLQCRFMVTEQTARIDADVSVSTDIDYRNAHQQLAVTVDTERSMVDDPFNDITLVIQQNGRYDNEVALRQPLRTMGRKSIYEHLPQLIFPAGNEYRRFETVSTRYPGMRVADISYFTPYYHFLLEPDASRAGEPYLYDQTQQGAFLVREYNSTESAVEADYGVVHFTLDYPEIPGMMVFIDGDLTNRRFDPSSLMTFNRATGRYEHVMLLKQGSYNYQYLAVPSGASSGRTSVIEGDRYPTVNRYDIKVYHRRRGERYDRLIGVTSVYSDNRIQ